MAGNRRIGLNSYTVQEATSKIASSRIVRVTPTVIAGETADNDVMFDATEIPNAVLQPGGTSKLVGITIIDKDGERHDFDVIFMQVQTNFGTADSATTITDASLQAAKVTGALSIDWSDGEVFFAQNSGDAAIFCATLGTGTSSNHSLTQMLQAEEGSTSVYFTGIAQGAAIDYAATDDLEFVFHIDY